MLQVVIEKFTFLDAKCGGMSFSASTCHADQALLGATFIEWSTII